MEWRGDENVLDVGCGRGLVLVGAAKWLGKGGKSFGIDIWQAQDLSGNRPEATLENARLEGVAERVEVKTADMRKIPFPDGTFNRIVSKKAIHNLYGAPDRATALSEIVRVLKPGGAVVISDIGHFHEYAAELKSRGLIDVERVGSGVELDLRGALLRKGDLRDAAGEKAGHRYGRAGERWGAPGGLGRGRAVGRLASGESLPHKEELLKDGHQAPGPTGGQGQSPLGARNSRP